MRRCLQDPDVRELLEEGKGCLPLAVRGWVGIRSSLGSLSRPARNPFNPQPLISHLTNSNGCGNLHAKVADSVPVWSLPSPATPCVSTTLRFIAPLFSYSYKPLFPQPLSFHIHTKPPGCHPPACRFEASSPL